jgi:hypothetical protein
MYGGGAEYCAACDARCPDCPMALHRPRTVEGRAVWALVERLGGQLRVASGMGGGAVLGVDLGAALALGAAMGIPRAAVAELLPVIEAAMVKALGEQAERAQLEGDGHG